MWVLFKTDISQEFETDYTRLLPINKINFIIGKNNSGKSYFMRHIIKNVICVFHSKDEIIDIIKNDIKRTKINYNEYCKSLNFEISSLASFFSISLDKLDKLKQTAERASRGVAFGTYGSYDNFNYSKIDEDVEKFLKHIGIFIEKLDITNNLDIHLMRDYNKTITLVEENFIENILSICDKVSIEKLHELGFIFNLLESKDQIPSNLQLNYLPIVRSLRHPLKHNFEKNDLEDCYKKRIMFEYNYDENLNVITGLDFYKKFKKSLLGKKESRESVKLFENFLSKYFFDNKELSIIPEEESFEIMISISNTEDKFIYQVGDGISSLIILFFELFTSVKLMGTKLFFIEEPENSFHAGYQRLLISVISFYEEFKDCFFFFTTHSNDLIDIGTSEYNNSELFLCVNNYKKVKVSRQDSSKNDVIKELDVKPSSLCIVNKVIWVEGKYDAFYIRLLMNLKNMNTSNESKMYIEDYDYSFLPYGGSNIKLINFSEKSSEELDLEFIVQAKKINPNFLVIMDDDEISKTTRGKKFERYNKLKELLGDSLYKLNVREIENMFPVEVLRNFVSDNIKKEFNKENFIFEYEKYKTKKLGAYLNSFFDIDTLFEKTGRTNGFEKNGFLYDKLKFYNAVLRWAQKDDFNYEKDVTNEAKELINIIENFLAK